MKFKLEFNSLSEGPPKEAGEYVCLLRGELIRAEWNSLSWESDRYTTMIIPDYYAEVPEELRNKWRLK